MNTMQLNSMSVEMVRQYAGEQLALGALKRVAKSVRGERWLDSRSHDVGYWSVASGQPPG